ncbi:response regulator transcription factor [Gottfriedia luciferensis]|uniref:response regulator transcription factor n=1 Tax=Gottfriedia luciferensis TaxID=178774 RepID=UPI000B44F05C|nr:response regulator transcription factor [Gottfriedia luciferensis]
MFANNLLNHQENKTFIFVENALFVSGICTILENYKMDVKKIDFHQINTFELDETYFICYVKNEEMEKKSQLVKLRNRKANVIILKNNLDYNEIVRLISIGVNAICLADIDEQYLIQIIKQVQNGHFFLDSRLTNKIIQENNRLIEDSKKRKELDYRSMKNLLTRREIEILQLLAQGYSNIQIGTELFISSKTVKNHVSNIIHKLQVSDRLNAVILAVKNNWITLE